MKTAGLMPTQARFGKMFDLPPRPDVRPFPADLGLPGGPMDGGFVAPINPTIPAVMTYFGQFVDHDITLDLTSSLEKQNDADALVNFRTPVLELDSVYGLGPSGSPHLYDQRPANANKLLVGTAADDETKEVDLPRNSQGVALVGDPRNGENLIVSQLHVAFLKFHNAVVDRLDEIKDDVEGESPFEKAQRLVRWHYQWLILHHFLPAIVGQHTIDAILNKNFLLYEPTGIPFIPVEFSVAAYRFGHSMVQPAYGINDDFAAPLFSVVPNQRDLRGGPVRAGEVVNWKNFVDTGFPPSNVSRTIQSSMIDTKLAGPLLALPETIVPNSAPAAARSLAFRNLERSVRLGLPSGQAVAELFEKKKVPEFIALGDDELWHGTAFSKEPAPLWFYILREAEVRSLGRRLGPMGARIVGEVILKLLELDMSSFRAKNPKWTPTVPGRERKEDFTFVDFFRIAGVPIR